MICDGLIRRLSAAFAGASFARASQDSLRRATGMCSCSVLIGITALEMGTRSAA